MVRFRTRQYSLDRRDGHAELTTTNGIAHVLLTINTTQLLYENCLWASTGPGDVVVRLQQSPLIFLCLLLASADELLLMIGLLFDLLRK